MLVSKTLIDKGAKLCGSDAGLADALRVSRAYISQIRSGKRELSPRMAGLLAHLIGEDVAPAMLDVVKRRLGRTSTDNELRAAMQAEKGRT